MSEEIKLLRASLQGDTAAFEQIVLRYQAMVCAITYSATGRVETSEELAQETFLRAWQRLVQLQDPNKFRSWLCSIARNLIRDYLLHKSRQPIQSADLTQLPADKTTPFDHLIKQEEEMILSHALMQIPEEFRETLVLYYRQEQSVKEVAESLDIPEATVRTRMHRGRQMLKDQVSSMVEQRLEKNGPNKKFTKAVMVSIGAGLAAGTAATAGVAAAGASISTTTTTGILTAAGAKVAAIAAAVILAAGAAIYSYQNSQENAPNPQPIQQQSLTEITPQTERLATIAVKQEEIKPQPPAQQPPEKPVVIEKKPQPQMEAPKVRHPDWPKLNEPVQQLYYHSPVIIVSKVTDEPTVQPDTHPDSDSLKIWIKLPNQYRKEDYKSIEIYNGNVKIQVDKSKKTIQRTQSDNTAAASALENEILLLATLFRYSQNPVNEPNAMDKYNIKQIGSQDNGNLLIYQLSPITQNSELNYDVKAYVDTTTLLPEKIIVISTDPNEPSFNKPLQEILFDFSPIPDSLFSYRPQPDETQLPQKESAGFYGHVVDLLNNPVAGAEVYVNYFPLWGLDYLKSVTDNTGRFEIKRPDKSPNNTSNINLPIYFWAILPDRQDFSAWTVLYEEYGIRNGVDPNLLPGFGGTIVSERTTGTGTYTKNGVTSTYQYFSPSLKDPVVRDIVLVMQPTGTIAGYVTDKAGNGINGAKLECKYQFAAEPGKLMSFHANNFKWTFSAVSDSNGYYMIKGLPSLWKYCRFSISISVPGYAGENKEIILDEPLSHLDYNISLNQQQVAIRGILKDNSGIPLANRDISLSAPNISLKDSSLRTDPNGNFEFKGCPDIPGLHVEAQLSWSNPYNMIDQKEKYDAMLYYPNVGMDIPYNPGQKDYTVELTAIRPETEIEISVIDSAGHPIPEIKVQLDNTRHSISYKWQQKLQKRTDKNGVVKFTNIPDMQELTVFVQPSETFTLEFHRFTGSNSRERERIDQLDRKYEALYQKTEIPVPLVPGQKKYKMTIPILTQEEYKQQKEIEKSGQNQ